MLFAYWEGLPDSGWCHVDVQSRLSLMSSPCEDGIHLLSVAGPARADARFGDSSARRPTSPPCRRFPRPFNPHLLDGARRVSPLVVVPETMLRGFVRPATGPGWALVGDAGLFKHPVTAQGIGDALAQAWYVGTALGRGDDLADYARWRDEQAAGHYEWSYELAKFPSPDAAAVWAGLAADPVAGPELLDTFARRHRPDDVLSPARRARWRAAWAYEKGIDELTGPARWSRRRLHAGGRPGLPAVDRGRPPRPPGRGRPGRRPRGLLRRGDGGVARPGAGRRAGRLDRRAPPPVRRPWARGAAARAAPARMPGSCRRCAAARTRSARLRRGWCRRRPPTSPCTWPTCARRSGSPRTPTAPRPGSGVGAYRGWLHQRLVDHGCARPPALRRRRRVGRRRRQPGRRP